MFACPVLAIYGGADRGIPAEARETFDRALDSAGVEHRSITFEGAPHSFFDRKAADHADASEETWREVLSFMGM
jgi:carboxymethylenebutenolidase